MNKRDLVKAQMHTTDVANSHTDGSAYTVNKEYTQRHINTKVVRLLMKKYVRI